MMQSNLPKRLKPEAYFTCEHSKELISTLAKCDNVIDCLDASDEVTCPNGCDDNEFSCGGGHCIKFSLVCDFISDCADGTDETCDFQKCDENEFRCDNKQCIPSEKRCNSKPDCLDKSDEENCESCTNSFLCADEFKCIPLRLTCDRYPDCTDSSDELTCHLKIPTSDDMRDDYVSLAGREGFSLDLQSIEYESGRITVFGYGSMVYKECLRKGYSCIRRMKYDCQLRFHEAAVVDNLNNEFAYPFCYCRERVHTE
ncbi:LDL receptor repeat-containing protein egg-1-like, partial [Ruditapes philippinarum]|uniref:LDL receptor repeat-containing protein egg-1-like n=1 Tax=Ruditapes philippinarum TaxID=129788 RepID=UPI00295BBCB9